MSRSQFEVGNSPTKFIWISRFDCSTSESGDIEKATKGQTMHLEIMKNQAFWGPRPLEYRQADVFCAWSGILAPWTYTFGLWTHLHRAKIKFEKKNDIYIYPNIPSFQLERLFCNDLCVLQCHSFYYVLLFCMALPLLLPLHIIIIFSSSSFLSSSS